MDHPASMPACQARRWRRGAGERGFTAHPACWLPGFRQAGLRGQGSRSLLSVEDLLGRPGVSAFGNSCMDAPRHPPLPAPLPPHGPAASVPGRLGGSVSRRLPLQRPGHRQEWCMTARSTSPTRTGQSWQAQSPVTDQGRRSSPRWQWRCSGLPRAAGPRGVCRRGATLPGAGDGAGP